MPTMPAVFRPHGRPDRREQNREADARRGSARERGYDSKWDKASASRLKRHPLCEYCEAGAFGEPPRTTAATLTDHLFPHRGARLIFWRSEWWVSSCKPCHDGPKQALERRGLAALNALAALLGRPPFDGSA